MKRDMELMRKILFKIEEEFKAGEQIRSGFNMDGYDYITVGEHCELLYEEGLIKDYQPIRGGRGNSLLNFSIGNLTSRGYDYLELIRNEEVWVKTNEEVKTRKLPQTIETIGTVAASIIGAFMREYQR